MVHPYTQEMCKELIRLFDTMEEGAPTGFGRGTALVFLPGMGEITDMMGYLDPIVGKEKLQLIPLHSKIHFDEQQKAFSRVEKGYRKVGQGWLFGSHTLRLYSGLDVEFFYRCTDYAYIVLQMIAYSYFDTM